MACILVADDDGHIREVVRYALEKAGYSVLEAADGAQALKMMGEQSIDLVVLDIVMPERDGIEVCRRLLSTSKVPIVFLTSRDDELDRVLGLELGADDYVTKPFSPRELVARVKAVLRRTEAIGSDAETKKTLEFDKLSLDVERHRCRWMDGEIILTPTEFSLLQTMLGMPGKVYSRGDLVDRAYGFGHHITDRTIDSHVRRIRKKLADAGAEDLIETVHGVGYRLGK